MLMYVDDYDGTPPFILKDAKHDDPMVNNGENRRKETWLASASTMQRIYLLSEEEWPTDKSLALPRSGDLFPYARFASLYRCPEFERVRDPNKHQNAFNYTRSIAGRRADPDHPGQFDGEILKIEAVHQPGKLPIMLDEAWDCHVAWPEPYRWGWCGVDCVGDLLNSCLGQYHGSPVPGLAWYPRSDPPGSENGVVSNVPVKRASVGFYDGHAELMRDPLPNMEHADGRPAAYPFHAYAQTYLDWVAKLIHAQKGVTPKFGEQGG